MSVRNPCKNHPDREGKVFCQKYNRWYCGDCIQCYQPKQYCKFRTACMIWEFMKYGIPEEFKEHPADDANASTQPAESATPPEQNDQKQPDAAPPAEEDAPLPRAASR